MTTAQVRNIAAAKEGDKVISSVAMVVALVSFAMLFATLMMGFALFRFSAPIWPPAGMEKPSLFFPSISTLFIFLSSWTYILFEKDAEKGVAQRKFLAATFILGCAFMVSQFIFWGELKSHGIFASSGIFPSIIYAFTWIHAAHIVAALGLLAWLYRAITASETTTLAVKISSVGKFWHFLGIVWLIMFVTIFVL